MARSIALAAGQKLPSYSMADFFRRTVETVQAIAAAGRVGAAYRDGVAPSRHDLKAAGLEGFEVLTKKHPI